MSSKLILVILSVVSFFTAIAINPAAVDAANNRRDFDVEIGGVATGGIVRVEGLKFEVEVVEYKDGEDRILQTRPGNSKPGTVTFVRKYGNTPEFYSWFQATREGKVERRSITIKIFTDNYSGKVFSQVHLHECWPTKWQIDGFDPNGPAPAQVTESLTVNIGRIEFTK
jgi:phage tail-like protein